MANNPKFSPIGRNVEASVEGETLILKIALKDGQPSGSGKMSLYGSTPGGFVAVPGTVPPVKVNLNVGVSVKDLAR